MQRHAINKIGHQSLIANILFFYREPSDRFIEFVSQCHIKYRINYLVKEMHLNGMALLLASACSRIILDGWMWEKIMHGQPLSTSVSKKRQGPPCFATWYTRQVQLDSIGDRWWDCVPKVIPSCLWQFHSECIEPSWHVSAIASEVRLGWLG